MGITLKAVKFRAILNEHQSRKYEYSQKQNHQVLREITSLIERHKQQNDSRYPLREKNPFQLRVTFRKRFLITIRPIKNWSKNERVCRWKDREQNTIKDLT